MNLNEIYIRDPFILPYKGVYYLYGKTSEDSLEFVVYKSFDLKKWSEPICVFRRTKDFWATKEFWAPEVHIYNNQFYMFASFSSETHCRGTQILRADTPEGPFVPISEFAQTPREWECLDGTLYVGRDGVPYMVFCHEWTQIQNGTICFARLSSNLTKFETAPKEMFRAKDFDFVISMEPGRDSYVTDGPFLYRNEAGELRLMWSSFGEQGYFINELKSDNGEIDGNWSSAGMIYEQNGGHAMTFCTFEGKRKIVFHTPNAPAGAERAVILDL